jgi:hypothetical protein
MASEERKFYRTVIEVEVLSEGEITDRGLVEIASEMKYGFFSGVYNFKETQEVTPDEMAELLIKQGSDPEFLLGELDNESGW